MRNVLSRRRLVPALLLIGLGIAAIAAARSPKKSHKRPQPQRQTPQPPEVVKVDYASQIKPILEAHCYSCHGPNQHKGGLRLDTLAGIWKGSHGGGVVNPGDGNGSTLVAVLTGAEDKPRMPPSENPLSPKQIALIKAWINEGASTPAGEGSAEEPSVPITTDHWAFRTPVASPVPTGVGNPIDAFLAAGRDRLGLTPVAEAPRAVLLRRVFIDLVGLPPTREELAAFLADTSEGAYERVVERLLASPRYGERWARHWMDVWRYSDADGRKAKGDVWWGSVHVWRWRDWIINSLNEDMGYDRMVVEMLAGDEAAPGDPRALAATGFLVRNWFKLDRDVWLGTTVEHTGKAFLGLSIVCAKCHDHKFDPIRQRDYYRFRAFFEPHDVRADPVAGESGPGAFVARAFDANPGAPTWLLIRGDPKTPDKSAPVPPGVPAFFGNITGVPATELPPGSTGRRLALARWIVDGGNPLTARVAVNHVWARHFGRPLVENVADFGARTPAPAQQPLLDWLAVDFMDHGWSMKHLHRLIVTSAAYKMHSSARGAPPKNLEADQDNAFYWRADARRMEAEVVRDSLLWLAGALEEKAGGPPVDPARGTDTGRRSLYYRYSREDKMEFLTAFDAPGVEECYRRQKSIVPQQALALENSEFSWDQARRIARRLEADAPAPAVFVTAAFEHVLGRPPEAAEARACEAFLARQAQLLADPSSLMPLPPTPPPTPPDPEVVKRVKGLPLVLGTAEPLPHVGPHPDPAAQAREYLVHALLNHNDFITVR
jgi:mono/diheme cytochrome c family protein